MNQLVFFVCVGASAAFVHFLGLLIAVQGLSLPPSWGNVVGFCCAFVVSFLGHLKLTFRRYNTTQDSRRISSYFWRWLLTSVMAFALNQLLFIVGISVLTEKYYLLVWFFVTGIVTIVTFLLGKLWAFR